MTCFSFVAATSSALTKYRALSTRCLLSVRCCFLSDYSLSYTDRAPCVFSTLAAERGRQRNDPPAKAQWHSPSQPTPIRRPRQDDRRFTTKSTPLERPNIIFSNNHLLVVNKPAGWKSQPGDGVIGRADPKCLLTYLKSQFLGGGSKRDFLIPTHRLDQPCTGVLIFAKNGKAASRVQVAWSKKRVKKVYWVVVEGGPIDRGRGTKGKRDGGLELLRSRSARTDGKTYLLSARLASAGGKGKKARGGGSVVATPLLPDSMQTERDNNGRVCHVQWEHLLRLPASNDSSNTRHLLSVTTDTGAKHQVRALLAFGGAPLAGDLRYGNRRNSQRQSDESEFLQGTVDAPLPDASVALHARSVYMPTVSLGGMEFLEDEPFVADVPEGWTDFFGMRRDELDEF
ncbi:hypothetical protein ACHAWF_005129 [Thalassiosira exigua]